MYTFNHFVLTRFNVKVDGWGTTKNHEVVRDSQWLEHRFNIFQKYCLPSVINQENQNFFWYVFFDIDTPEYYRLKADAIAKRYKNFVPIYIDGLKSLLHIVVPIINEQVSKSECNYIITTRLDNDDILHKDFIGSIQHEFFPIDKTVIDIRSGYQLSIEKRRCEVREYTNIFNAFISVIESSVEFQTVASRMHADWSRAESVVVVEKNRLWIELVHEKNFVNSIRNDIKRVSTFNFEEFGLNRDSFNLDSRVVVLWSNLYTRMKLFFIYQLRRNEYINEIAKYLKGKFISIRKSDRM